MEPSFALVPESTDPAEVVRSLVAECWSGTAVLGQAGGTRRLQFEAGRLIAAASDHPEHEILGHLLKQGLLDLARHDAVLSSLRGEQPETVLLRDEILRPRALAAAEEQLAEEIVEAALREPACVPRLEPGVKASREMRSVRRSTPELVLAALRGVLSWPRIRRGIGGPRSVYVRGDEARAVAPIVAVVPSVSAVIAAVDGTREVSAIGAASGLSDFEACRVLWALRVLGAIRPCGAWQAAAATAPAPTPARAPAPAPTPAPVARPRAAAGPAPAAPPSPVPPAADIRGRILRVALPEALRHALDPLLHRWRFALDDEPTAAAALDRLSRGDVDLVMVGHALPDLALGAFLARVHDVCPRSILLVAAAADVLQHARQTLGSRADVVPDQPREVLEQVAVRLLAAPRRLAVRLLVKLEVQVQDGRRRLACQSENLSSAGVFLRTNDSYPPGTRLTLEFTLPGDRQPIVVESEVVRHAHPGIETLQGMGVRFGEFRGDGLARLQAYCARPTVEPPARRAR